MFRKGSDASSLFACKLCKTRLFRKLGDASSLFAGKLFETFLFRKLGDASSLFAGKLCKAFLFRKSGDASSLFACELCKTFLFRKVSDASSLFACKLCETRLFRKGGDAGSLFAFKPFKTRLFRNCRVFRVFLRATLVVREGLETRLFRTFRGFGRLFRFGDASFNGGFAFRTLGLPCGRRPEPNGVACRAQIVDLQNEASARRKGDLDRLGGLATARGSEVGDRTSIGVAHGEGGEDIAALGHRVVEGAAKLEGEARGSAKHNTARRVGADSVANLLAVDGDLLIAEAEIASKAEDAGAHGELRHRERHFLVRAHALVNAPHLLARHAMHRDGGFVRKDRGVEASAKRLGHSLHRHARASQRLEREHVFGAVHREHRLELGPRLLERYPGQHEAACGGEEGNLAGVSVVQARVVQAAGRCTQHVAAEDDGRTAIDLAQNGREATRNDEGAVVHRDDEVPAGRREGTTKRLTKFDRSRAIVVVRATRFHARPNAIVANAARKRLIARKYQAARALNVATPRRNNGLRARAIRSATERHVQDARLRQTHGPATVSRCGAEFRMHDGNASSRSVEFATGHTANATTC